jgi:formylglycine-generating enzyme required for sulfatase activity
MAKFFRPPPTDAHDFSDLFRTIWNQGIGNTAKSEGGCGEKWDYGSLIDAFAKQNASVSETTINNWLAGHHAPRAPNLYQLARIVSNQATFEAWRDALFKSADEKRRRPSGQTHANLAQHDAAQIAVAASNPAIASTKASPSSAPALRARRFFALQRLGMAIGLGTAMFVLAGFGLHFALQPRIADLKVCDVANFSVANQSCSRHLDTFPDGTKRVYVSFDVLNYPENKPFTRTWFFNGQKLSEREGLLAKPWDGWTWFGNKEPDKPGAVAMDSGNYTFRVMAGPAVRTVFFQIGAGDQRKPGHRFRDKFRNGAAGFGPEMVVLPKTGPVKPGPSLGKASPPERVGRAAAIIYQMAVSATEVTWDEWAACVNDGGCNAYRPEGRNGAPGDHPVVNVSHNDVFAYIQWLNGKLGIAQERFDRYTLLTEAEWEYAALAGASEGSLNGYGAGATITPQQAHFGQSLASGQPRAVGSFPANAWGLADMHGNVAERVEDCHRNGRDEPRRDGSALLEAQCLTRVVKGGSFLNEPADLRAGARYPHSPERRAPDVGFRLVRRLEQRTS